MRLVTPEVAADIARIVEEGHTALVAALFGPEAAGGSEAWRAAVDMGLVAPGDEPTMAGAHLFGALIAHLAQTGDESRYGTTEAEFAAEVRRHPVPRTAREEESARAVLQRGGRRIKGLGNRAGATLADRAEGYSLELEHRMRDTILDAIAARYGDDAAAARTRDRGVARGLPPGYFDDAFRATVGRITSDVGHLTDDWARDVQRIVQTEGQTAVQRGTADRWRAEEDEAAQAGYSPRTLVYKVPRPGACAHCIRLHLDGGYPRLYDLDDAQANGDNAGRKAADWRFVVGSVHPWCGCPMHRVPRSVRMPAGWRSGDAAPSVIGADGALVIPDGR